MNPVQLYTGTTTGAAILLSVIWFVLGAVATCVICKGRCKCTGAKAKGPASPEAKPQSDEPKFQKKHPAPADGSIEIYVGNLSYDLTEAELRKEFEAFGQVNQARIICNRYNGKSKGYGFIHMPNESEVKAALAALTDKEILGRKLKCNVAKNLA